MPDAQRLILASGSATRRAMLASAGLEFSVELSDVDEHATRERMRSGGGSVEPQAIAAALAAEKAVVVSRKHPESLVIGADQVLALGSQTFDKAHSIEAARERIEMLNGKTHELHSAVALAQAGVVVWQHLSTATLTMRKMSESFIDSYLQFAGRALFSSVGAYELEGSGVQMFERIDGDYFTILGLPLLPLLAELRNRKAIAS
jgi:septum formation protein